VIVKEERLSEFSFSPFCKSLVKAQVKFTSGKPGLSQRLEGMVFSQSSCEFWPDTDKCPLAPVLLWVTF